MHETGVPQAAAEHAATARDTLSGTAATARDRAAEHAATARDAATAKYSELTAEVGAASYSAIQPSALILVMFRARL